MFFKKPSIDGNAHREEYVSWLAAALRTYFETESDFDPQSIGLILNEEDGEKKIHPLRADGYFIELMNEVLKSANWFSRRRFWNTLIRRFRNVEEGLGAVDPVEVAVLIESWRQQYRNSHGVDILQHVHVEELLETYEVVRAEVVRQLFNATFGHHESLEWVVEDLTMLYLDRVESGERWNDYEWPLFVFNYFGHVDRMRFIVSFNLAVESSNLLLETDPKLHQRVMWQAVPDLFFVTYLYQLAHGDVVVEYPKLVEIGLLHGVHEKSDVAQVFAEHGVQMGDDIPLIRVGAPGDTVLAEAELPDDAPAQGDPLEASQEMPVVVGIEGNTFWDPWETSTLESIESENENLPENFFPGERLGVPLASYAEGELKLSIHDNLGPDRTMDCDASRHLFSMLVGESPTEESREVMKHLPFRAGIYVIYREGQGSAFAGYWIDGWSQAVAVPEDTYEGATRDHRASWSLDVRVGDDDLAAIWEEHAEGPQAMPILFEAH